MHHQAVPDNNHGLSRKRRIQAKSTSKRIPLVPKPERICLQRVLNQESEPVRRSSDPPSLQDARMGVTDLCRTQEIELRSRSTCRKSGARHQAGQRNDRPTPVSSAKNPTPVNGTRRFHLQHRQKSRRHRQHKNVQSAIVATCTCVGETPIRSSLAKVSALSDNITSRRSAKPPCMCMCW